MDDNLIFDRFGELEAWVVNGKKYDWNGGFHIPTIELKKLSVNELPLHEKVQPIDNDVEDYIIPSTPNFYLIRVNQGIVVNVEGIFQSNYWSHLVPSLPCFIDSLVEELRSNQEFQLKNYQNNQVGKYVVEYQTMLVDVETISEAITLAVHSLKSLEKRVNLRLERENGSV
ncbi:hypothetical protein DS745_22375 [Anaerobacillus alkaliphilus]|uniref:Uncharacterized protein n=1 Tax=Anaerobacillus alkaliphilus TaxID=1548597 RepID=A0A4V1LFU0_9BACI|nr:hypothetical protein [Anaerobacillus alkaliphilus]RXI96459.1 hypothetical protein DS745_22375 [Anaerobacillus alkaliphilus]